MNEAIIQMVEKYNPKSDADYELALREVLQEVLLLGLDRSGFFEKAAFYGGTALRILYGLDRFSEDIDFTLLKPDLGFRIDRYFSGIEQELAAYGFQFELERVDKGEDRQTESAFMKLNTQLLYLNIHSAKGLAHKIQKNQKLKIKFEIDVDPATAFDTEIRILDLPSPFTVKTLTKPSLFAGKMHAVLMRKWKQRTKGRDFYDLQWYLARNVPVNKKYLSSKLRQSGAIEEEITRDKLVEMLEERIQKVNWDDAKSDVIRFLRDKTQVNLWSQEYFLHLVKKVELV